MTGGSSSACRTQPIGLVAMRRLIPLLALVVACSSTISTDKLAEIVQPLVDAHELMENWEFQIDGGLTYGAILDTWPERAAEIRTALGQFDGSELEQGDLNDAEAYRQRLNTAFDHLDDVATAVGDYIRDDGAESAIATPLDRYYSSASLLETARENALAPGDNT